MENKIEVFNNEQFGEIRVVLQDNKPWFVAQEVCNALEIKNVSHAVSRLDDDEKMTIVLNDSHSGNRGGAQKLLVVSEEGLYALVLGSRKKEAKAFKRWVTHDVLPDIRKHGMYMTDSLADRIMSDPETIGKMMLAYAEEKKKNKELTTENAELKETVMYKENVIVGLTKDIDLATKRNRIYQIVNRGIKNQDKRIKRWALLYSEFEKKYHVNLSLRLDKHKNKYTPKLKNKMDVIDRELGMIAETYEICCKLFENDIKDLLKEWEVTIVR